LHTGLRAQSAPGFPCALFNERDNEGAKLGQIVPRECGRVFHFVIASEAKQSSFLLALSWIASSLSLLAMTVVRHRAKTKTADLAARRSCDAVCSSVA